MLPNNQESTGMDEALYDGIEKTLTELNDEGFFKSLRHLVQNNEFFNPKAGFIKDAEESETAEVLDVFRLYLKEHFIDTGDDKDGKYAFINRVLEPGSDLRKVVLAYYEVSENTDWTITSGAISSRQTFNNINFPSYFDISELVKRISVGN